jgi:ferritin
MCHALKFYMYINSLGGHAVLKAIEKPPAQFKSGLQIFEEVLKHENKVTALINELVALAKAEKDFASEIFLQWFVSEQVEEEAGVQEIVDKLRMIGDKSSAALYLDQEYGKRQRAAP